MKASLIKQFAMETNEQVERYKSELEIKIQSVHM